MNLFMPLLRICITPGNTCNPTRMRDNLILGEQLQNYPKLSHIHVRLHHDCNAIEKRLPWKEQFDFLFSSSSLESAHICHFYRFIYHAYRKPYISLRGFCCFEKHAPRKKNSSGFRFLVSLTFREKAPLCIRVALKKNQLSVTSLIRSHSNHFNDNSIYNFALLTSQKCSKLSVLVVEKIALKSIVRDWERGTESGVNTSWADI